MNQILFKSRFCSSDMVFVPFHCVAMLVGLCYSNHTSLLTQSPAANKLQKAINLCNFYLRKFTPQNVDDKKQPRFRIKGPIRTPKTTCTSCFLGSIIFKGQLNPCPSQMFILGCFFFFLYMYELYSVCASLLCKTQKDETKQKKMTKALQRGLKTVCWWNSDHVI